ncbi:MAG: MotA/TolQ/ExbB proton channel family protein [Burkholderiales bacterium]|nr:MotA/TolQ/ExbB proton channel family protein [Burkholderiales bacterium]
MSLNPSHLRASLAAAMIAFVTLAATVPLPAWAQAAPAPEAASAPSAPSVAQPPQLATSANAPAPAKPVISEEAVENPYGLKALWNQGDWVAKGTLIILLIMSMSSWYVMFTKVFEQRVMMKSAKTSADAFWKASSVKAGVGTLEEGSAFRWIAEQGVKASEHHEGTMVESIDKHTWISMSVDRSVGNVNSRLQDGLALLATVGSTAPFVGLFGTVWGIYNALVKIGISGQASIDKVAGPVGEALIMTAIGLAVAVPAVMGYNWLVRRNKSVMDLTRAFAGDLHNVLIAGKR